MILGYFQFAEEEVNLDKAKEIGAAIVRRLSRGGATYQDLGYLIWSIAVRGPARGGTKFPYTDLLRGFIDTLKMLGVEATIEM